MLRLTLRRKLLLFAVVIAVLPLLVAGRSMIRIAQDELKSSANEQLVTTASEIVREINDLYERTWLAPLLLIRNAVDGEMLGVQEKIALLTLGIADLPDIVALQITVEGAPLPVVVTQDRFSRHLEASGLVPLDVLRVPPDRIAALRESGNVYAGDVTRIAATGDWLATIVLPLDTMLAGSRATLSARIDLYGLQRLLREHPFATTGEVTLVDAAGSTVLDAQTEDRADYPIVEAAVGMLAGGPRLVSVEPYVRPDGDVMLGAFGFPRPFDWAVLVEKSQDDAYLAITRMTDNLIVWSLAGLAAAVAGAALLALRMSGPILEIERVAARVETGDFSARVVQGLRLRDEIGDLARRINQMVVGLGERFQLEKFVSGETVEAIRGSTFEGVKLGGERREVTILFCDIRGYTAFAEKNPPETVVEVLNFHFQHLTDLVATHQGDIDKFVGDQILAVFQGETMALDAVRCALAMQAKMAELGQERPDWHLAVGIGINTGEVTMGAMGSDRRMDFTVLGDAVNLAARLCSHADRGQTLISRTTQLAVADASDLATKRLNAISVKGKRETVTVYQVVTQPRSLADVSLARRQMRSSRPAGDR